MRQTLHACLAWLALALGAAGPVAAAPTTFNNVIGNAILCRSHLDNHYFNDYLAAAFGPPYKREGGAYWYKTDGNLWGTQVTDVIVSDDTSELVFVGAVAETTPELLGDAVRSAVGLRHVKVDNTQFSALAANLGSKIVFFNARSKIYCAKFKQLPPHLQSR